MARIAYTDKETAQVSPLPAEQKWTSGDANVVKESVNAIYDADAAAGGEVMFNDGTGVGKSGDLTFDGALQIGANSNAGQVQLGGATGSAVGTVSSNGTLTIEGEDVVVSGGNSVELTTNAVSRLEVDADGTWLVEGSAGTSNQVLKTNGAGAPPGWGDINTDEVTDNSTIGGGAQNLTTSLDAVADALNNLPAPPVTSVNGAVGDVVLTTNDIDITEFVLVTIEGLFVNESFRFVTSGQYQRVSNAAWTLVNNNGGFSGWLCSPDGGITPYESNSPKTDPFTDITSWTNPASAVVPGNVVGYPGPTVQDALEQAAKTAADNSGGAAVAERTGATVAFDRYAVYNRPSAPSSASVTLDLTGAVAGTWVVAYFNHASEPTWPSGVTPIGPWNNSALNAVLFIYQDSNDIIAIINSNNAASPTTNGGWPRVDKDTTETRTNTTTLTADSDLQFPMIANGKYHVRCKLWGGVSGTGPGWKYGFTGPASPTLVRASGHHLSSVATPPANYTQNTYETTGKVFPSSAAGLHSVDLDLYIENGPNAGNFQITWAQNASNATQSSMGRGAFVEYIELP